MSIHRPHPLDSDPEGAILYDDCERCDEHAATLASLDNGNCTRLIRRVLGVEVGELDRYRTRTEARAGNTLWHAVLVLHRGTGKGVREILS